MDISLSATPTSSEPGMSKMLAESSVSPPKKTSHTTAETIKRVTPVMLRSFPKRTTNKNNQGKKVKRRTKQSIIATDNNGEQIFATTKEEDKKPTSCG